MDNGKKKRKGLTIDQKLEIIRYQEKNPTLKKTDIAKHFDIAKQTLSDILKSKDKILKECTEEADRPDTSARKRFRATDYDDVDAAMVIWFRQYYGMPDLRIDGEMLLAKAAYFANEFKHEKAPSPAWMDRWKKRRNIGKISKAGESGGVDMDVVVQWRDVVMIDILERYEPKNIFNSDETGLFWQLLPEKSLGFKGEQQKGKQQPKSRITLLVGSNMDGSEKMPLLAIGKYKNPRAFKNLKKPPVHYLANRKAWMTSELFAAEMKAFDRKMQAQNRKAVMIVDNCPAHPKIDLLNTELVFLPPRTTSVTQPMDAGIIKNLKFFYCRILASRRLQAAEEHEEFKWDMLDCLVAVRASWQEVKQTTLANCWRKAGFKQNATDETEDTADTTDDVEPETTTFRNIWDRLSEVLKCELPPFHEYVELEPEGESEQMAEAEIVARVTEDQQPVEDEPEIEGPGVVDDPPPTRSQAFAAVDVMRRYVLTLNAGPEQEAVLDLAGRFESMLVKTTPVGTQRRITDFFGGQTASD